MELGVEGVVLLALEGVDERGQTAGVVDHGRDVGRGRHRGCGPEGAAAAVSAPGDAKRGANNKGDRREVDKNVMTGSRFHPRPAPGESAPLRRRGAPE